MSAYKVKAKVWIYPGGTARWHFVTIPKKESALIKKKFGANARGWGSLPVTVTLGKTKWDTSIFPDRKSETYLLPLKAVVRRAEDVEEGEAISFSLAIRT